MKSSTRKHEVKRASATRTSQIIGILPPPNHTRSPTLHTIMAPSSVSEDERYRTSTQYRLWSFTPTSLLELRTTTNRNAANRVRDAVRRVREARAATSSGNTSEADGGNSRAVSAVPEGEVDCLSVEEELKLVTHFCRQTLQLGDHLQVPTDVKVST